MTKWCFCCLFSQPTSIGNVYLSLNLPKLRLFSTVHLAVDDQDIREASDVAGLHLKRCKKAQLQHARHRHKPPPPRFRDGEAGLTVGWYFSQFSHQAWVLCSRQMLFFKISAKSYSFTLSDESKNTEDDFTFSVQRLSHTTDEDARIQPWELCSG